MLEDGRKLYKLVNGIKLELSEDEYIQKGIDQEAHDAKKVLEASLKYKDDRKEAYGDIGDQLDMIYHEGLDAWKLHVASVKVQFPKPE